MFTSFGEHARAFLVKKMETFKNIQLKEQIIHDFVERCPFVHKDLALVVIPGSRNNETFGNCSDLDITTVMRPENHHIIDTKPLLELATQIQGWADRVHKNSPITPVVISTIRLEEAQIQMARMLTQGRKEILPIHWLFHPSFDFLAVNEPPSLARGILTGKTLYGNAEEAMVLLQEKQASPNRKIAGLDWLTDSLRVLVANFSNASDPRQPQGFLLQLASHNLHWFWKWNILETLARQVIGKDEVGWPQALQVVRDVKPDLSVVFDEIHKVRHAGESASLEDIVTLHTATFEIWPELPWT